VSSAGVPPLSPSRSALVAEWVRKAEADLDLAKREQAYPGASNSDAIGFHAQQAVEKIMKAVLIACGQTPPRTHDLSVLDQLLVSAGVGSTAATNDLAMLTVAAVHARYPGASLTAQDAADLLRIACSIWAKLRLLV
jgi:HEPN domain-containing protein